MDKKLPQCTDLDANSSGSASQLLNGSSLIPLWECRKKLLIVWALVGVEAVLLRAEQVARRRLLTILWQLYGAINLRGQGGAIEGCR